MSLSTSGETPKYVSVAQIPDFVPSAAASEYSINWFKEHGRVLVNGPPGPDGTPFVHFPTGQYDRNPAAIRAALAEGKAVHFENDIGPLRIKGFIKGNELNAEVGATLHPAVYFKIGKLHGDISSGSVTLPIPNNVWWKGKVTIIRPAPNSDLAALGLGDFLAKVDWAGLGCTLASHVLPLLAAV